MEWGEFCLFLRAMRGDECVITARSGSNLFYRVVSCEYKCWIIFVDDGG